MVWVPLPDCEDQNLGGFLFIFEVLLYFLIDLMLTAFPPVF